MSNMSGAERSSPPDQEVRLDLRENNPAGFFFTSEAARLEEEVREQEDRLHRMDSYVVPPGAWSVEEVMEGRRKEKEQAKQALDELKGKLALAQQFSLATLEGRKPPGATEFVDERIEVAAADLHAMVEAVTEMEGGDEQAEYQRWREVADTVAGLAGDVDQISAHRLGKSARWKALSAMRAAVKETAYGQQLEKQESARQHLAELQRVRDALASE